MFDNTPAAKEGTLESGDELVGINDTNVKVNFGICVSMLNFFFNICQHVDFFLNIRQHVDLMITAGQDKGGSGQDDPGNKGRRRDQVQQTTRRSKTRSVTRFEITSGQPLALPRKNLGPDLEEGEA